MTLINYIGIAMVAVPGIAVFAVTVNDSQSVLREALHFLTTAVLVLGYIVLAIYLMVRP